MFQQKMKEKEEGSYVREADESCQEKWKQSAPTHVKEHAKFAAGNNMKSKGENLNVTE